MKRNPQEPHILAKAFPSIAIAIALGVVSAVYVTNNWLIPNDSATSTGNTPQPKPQLVKPKVVKEIPLPLAKPELEEMAYHYFELPDADIESIVEKEEEDPVCPQEAFCEDERKNWVDKLKPTKRGRSGIHITTYGRPNDRYSDSNTRKKIGFKNNLIREGSVALSPAIYKKYKPKPGAAVYIDGVLVGFYEDRAPDGYKGTQYGQTIDIYDPKNKIGRVLKNAGEAKLAFREGRPLIPNKS